MEHWLPVASFPGYEVSDLGRVRSVDRVLVRSNGSPYHVRSRVMALTHAKGRQYTTVNLNAYGTKPVHQLVAAAFLGPRLPGLEVCHISGDKTDNRAVNLRWDTSSSNRHDSVSHGSHANAAKDLCPRGHRLEVPNLTAHDLARGARKCLSCSRAHARVTYARKRGLEIPDLQQLSDLYYERLVC